MPNHEFQPIVLYIPRIVMEVKNTTVERDQEQQVAIPNRDLYVVSILESAIRK